MEISWKLAVEANIREMFKMSKVPPMHECDARWGDYVRMEDA